MRVRYLHTGILLTLVALYAGLTLGVATNSHIATFAMARFHLRTDGFVPWALTAPMPWMYNFDTRVLASPRPLTREEREASSTRWVVNNHHPTRHLIFPTLRTTYYREKGSYYLYVVSRYRDRHMETTFRMDATESEGGITYALQRLQESP